MRYNPVWKGEEPDLTEEQWVILSRELVWLESSVFNPANLIAHHIDLTEDEKGPSILVYGEEGNTDDLFLLYNDEVEWVFLDDEEPI